jgi:hypothetical protein
MSLLTIVQQAALRLNYSSASNITTAFFNTDPAIQLIIACAQDAGDDAVDRVDWAALKEVVPLQFTGDGVTAAFPLPVGFRRLSPSDTFISSLYPTLQMPGPVNEDDLLAMKALPVVAQPSVWRQVGFNGLMSIEFFPVLGVGEIATFYAAQGTWIVDINGAPRVPPQWGADTDRSVFPERIILFGAIWRWKQAKGLDYAEAMDTAEKILDRHQAQEETGRTINMSRTFTYDTSTWFPGTIQDFGSDF